MPSDTASLLLSLTPILVSINTLSIILLIPVIIAYRARGPLPSPLIYYYAIGLMVRHFNSLARFLGFGSLLLDTPIWYCLLRKAIIVYVSKAGIFFAAFFAFRIWLVACAASDNRLVRHFNIERWMTILSVVLPIIPTLLNTLPQLIAPPPITDTSIPYVCKSGLLRQWQVYIVGAPVTLPPTILAIYCLGSIIHQHCVASVMTRYRLKASAPSSGMSIRALLITIINVVNSLYYCYFEIQHVFHLPAGGLMSQTYLNGRHPVDMGDFIVATWGIITFIIFGTAKESMDRTLLLLANKAKPITNATYQFSCLEQGMSEGEKILGAPTVLKTATTEPLESQKGPPKAISSVVVPRRRFSNITRIITPFHTPLIANYPFGETATTTLSGHAFHPRLVGGMGKSMISKDEGSKKKDEEEKFKEKARAEMMEDQTEVLGSSTCSSNGFISRTRSSSGVSLGLAPPGPLMSPPVSAVRRRKTWIHYHLS
ncbi:hypothetical protein BJ684DRAFT_19430 [Piptocephalis cylindrospora]|uniref:Uncharacterized protein n=1 Tax=Piptocephalis cylindrospora TaxID=1907219 RepID=A0A4P9Y595_9FUNG|nr:hypothetical protein BJ684DRAFT_19430 [Piptocephalis cylindrospora]|eukprot:RKP14137.1 hypothetical protein BJ684DRAFT_19430 [Piptocephalis cylindrospora]